MRLTKMSDYAMRLLMYLAHHPEQRCTIAEIATAYGISEGHLMKVTHQLAAGGFIETIRGKGGGMRLARLAAKMNLGATVRALESDFAIVECLGPGNACRLTGNCALTAVMVEARDSFLACLDQYTLADIVPANDKSRAATINFQRRLKKPGT